MRECKAPCVRDCKSRSADCHGICPLYQAYWQERQAEYERRKASKQQSDFDYDVKKSVRAYQKKYYR